MKLIATLIASLFAVAAFAGDKGEPVALKTTPNPVVAPAPTASAPAKAEVKKEAKPVKSTPAKDEKAAVPATKPASK